MKILLPDPALLKKTGDVDYFDWNYKFPIKYVQQYRFKVITRLLGKKKYTALLEAGTGSGIFLPELAKHCDQLYGCDIHSNFEPVKNLLNHYGIRNYNVGTQSIEKTTYADKTFDAVVAVSVLEFVDDLDKAVREIKRIMKDDGIFITICPMKSKFLDFVVSLYSTKKPEDEFKQSRMQVGEFLEKNFTLIEKRYMVPVIGRFFPVYTTYKLKK